MYPESNTTNEDDLTLLKNVITFNVCVVLLATLTTSLLSGDANTTASFLFSAIVIKLSMCVVVQVPAMIKFTSTVSASLNFSYAVFF